MAGARGHEEPRELLRLLIAAELVGEPFVQGDRLIGRDDRIGPALEDEELAAARLEGAEVSRCGAIQIGAKRGVDLRHVAIEIETPPVPVGAERPFEQAVERRLARRIGGRLEKTPVERTGLAAGRPAVVGRFARLIGRAGIEGLGRRDLGGGQAIGGISTLACERSRVEVTGRGIGDEWIGLEPIALRATGGDGGLGEKGELGVRKLVSGLAVGGDIVPHDGGMTPGAAHDRRADEYAVIIFRVMLGFDQPLLAAGRAARVIGALGRVAVERLGDVFADGGHHMGRKASPVFPFLRMTDEGVAIERRRRRGPHVCRRGGVAALNAIFHAVIPLVETAAVAPVARAVKNPFPLIRGQPHLDPNVGIRRILHRSHHTAESGHPLSDNLVGRRVVAGWHRLRRLDCRVGKLEAS